jgi:hypothetical protein
MQKSTKGDEESCAKNVAENKQGLTMLLSACLLATERK